jgi:hypothetical protein
MKPCMRRVCAALVATCAVAVTTDSHACADKVSVEDINIQLLMRDGCDPDFFVQADKWYGFWLDSSWDDLTGRQDACNLSHPYAKMIDSIFLINYALTDNYSAQWHATEDYWPESRALGTGYHGDIVNKFSDSAPGAEATTRAGRFLAQDDTRYFCPLYDGQGQGVPGQSNSTVNRASTIVHEMWHHWQHQNGYVTTHPTACALGACDAYYFHSVSAFDFGQLNNFSLNPLLFHSPYQIGVEFDCDVAEMSQPWIPNTTTSVARIYANTRIAGQFINAVGYRCGNPRPF